jgi:hypothetical protein
LHCSKRKKWQTGGEYFCRTLREHLGTGSVDFGSFLYVSCTWRRHKRCATGCWSVPLLAPPLPSRTPASLPLVAGGELHRPIANATEIRATTVAWAHDYADETGTAERSADTEGAGCAADQAGSQPRRRGWRRVGRRCATGGETKGRVVLDDSWVDMP